MNSIISLRTEDEDLDVQYEVISAIEINESITAEKVKVIEQLFSIDQCIAKNQQIIDNINNEIDKLTNHADGLDYTVAVASGIIAGLIDSFFVGEFNFAELKANADKHVNKFIENYAKLRGYKDKGQGLKGAIAFLERKFPVDQDNIWKGLGISSSKLHHLEDIAHHPTILGLVASIVLAFFRKAVFVDKEGKRHFVSLKTDMKDIAKIWAPIVISGILRWLVHLAESKYTEKNSKELPKPIQKLIGSLSCSPAIIEVLKCTDNWFGHLVSDMGGSKNTPDGGMGISGIFISLLKEISSLPFLNKSELPKFVSDLYSKRKWDLRSEMAIMEYAGKQAVPIILNELLVRTFYFVRHLISEYKKNDDWKGIEWDYVVPWRNRTITRMMTIASGTFVAVDAADAAIRASLKSGGEPATFFANMVLRVNFVGVGRFAIAIGSDTYMGYKRERLRDERLYRMSEHIFLGTAKIYYKQADMWIAAKEANEAVNQMKQTALSSLEFLRNSLLEIGIDLNKIASNYKEIEQNNPGLLTNISQILLYGK